MLFQGDAFLLNMTRKHYVVQLCDRPAVIQIARSKMDRAATFFCGAHLVVLEKTADETSAGPCLTQDATIKPPAPRCTVFLTRWHPTQHCFDGHVEMHVSDSNEPSVDNDAKVSTAHVTIRPAVPRRRMLKSM
jgi:hypothetical protein